MGPRSDPCRSERMDVSEQDTYATACPINDIKSLFMGSPSKVQVKAATGSGSDNRRCPVCPQLGDCQSHPRDTLRSRPPHKMPKAPAVVP
ncbi:hypothetical protein DPMN_044948 [Dreissena polymorpha]|uniref:Uncharacterized protein n=1 Tax=Dreissena polymorpha TaxID=45954 RepID=A0A9D4D446_DREPO|nr:hypothetical protein DPMN_044948 [Dreissena polymorpha]